ncbi:MAG: flavin reductase family protein [Bryobacteraceae bacterium]
MIIDPKTTPAEDVYKVLIGSIVPRPIAFVSTVSATGVRNVAPFSFFTVASADPPVLCFTPTGRKDTLVNIRETRQFVVNIVSEDFAEKMNTASGSYARDVDEFEIARLTPVASDLVRPPRVAESRVQMECELYQILEIGLGALVLGQVVRIHVDDRIVDHFRIDPDQLRAIGRMGGNTYSRTTDRFDLVRPKVG